MTRKQRLVNLVRLILKGTSDDDVEAVAQDQVTNEFCASARAVYGDHNAVPLLMAEPFISDLLADAGNREHKAAWELLNRLVEKPLADWEAP